MGVVIGVAGDDVAPTTTPHSCVQDERRKTTDEAEQASTATGQLQPVLPVWAFYSYIMLI